VMPQDGQAMNFMCANGPCFSSRPTTAQLLEPEFNVSYGTRMLAQLVTKQGSMREALKAYGPMNVGYYYADKVLSLYQQYGN
jgi:soluble lytic murein transglycosylase-like protein